MKAALLLPLLMLACVALAEGHTRKTLAPTPPRTAGSTTATKPPPQGTIQTSKGPVKVGTVAAGNARPKQGQAAGRGTTGAAKMLGSQAESCRSVGLREHCDNFEQANCCEYLGSNDKWQGCDMASNLYTCTSQFDNKPVSVCCS
ncbi:hypothetical protein OEZ85_001942 [Tetradesmus obliquus]|uniref:Uncharacterized protein n=2 Tax=Tetradesmus obliquus TaxID=3088 RepID=A0ABY8U5K3_TETOB|nr:hypothetical protein OEZ85_001942 [Tetradesmus obliquus]|eukprot:jgi/Sobl393_1/491/SZX71278.1